MVNDDGSPVLTKDDFMAERSKYHIMDDQKMIDEFFGQLSELS